VPRERKAPTFADASVFVLASRIEGMPNVVLEAMAHARPVICTRVFGADELVVDGETGLQIDIENEQQLAAALRTLLTDECLRTRMGRAGRARVETQFTWQATARAYLQLAGAA
jgi:glycosyltransferase involved in cell wall biosynthesis